MIPPVNLSIIHQDFAQLERLGSPYNYGGKAENLNGDIARGSELTSITPDMIAKQGGVDCSGFVRWEIARATEGRLIIPDGSQNQREWAEETLGNPVRYSDIAKYMTPYRLFICFIRPYHNNCGSVGHVWLVSHFNFGNKTKAGSIECHGGGGCTSRPWDYPTLIREVYSAYELPVVRP